MENSKHKPVLLNEVLHFLQFKKNEWYLDATLGSGGYTEALLENGAKVIGIDADQTSLESTERKIRKIDLSMKFIGVHDNFRNVDQILIANNIKQIDGAMFDLGISSDQLDNPQRGFSFLIDGPLDMRVNQEDQVTAKDLINGLGYRELVDLLIKFGEVEKPQLLAKSIIVYRKQKTIDSTQELADLISRTYQNKWRRRIHPATQVFMALRIAVNTELENLSIALTKIGSFVKPQGRLVIVSFHSLEDRIVKNIFKDSNEFRQVNSKPMLPTETEIAGNSRARSAKMRVYERI